MVARTALMTVIGAGRAPTIDEAAAQLGVARTDLDDAFGVVPLDPDRNLYVVEVQGEKLGDAAVDGSYRGPFSNPPIASFGPVRGSGEGQ